MKKSTKKQILSLLIVIAFLGSSFTYALMSTIPTDNQVQSDWVARVRIVINGELQYLPAGLGVDNQTTAKLFTTSDNNLIYKTGTDDARLSELFAIWGKNFNSTCILGYCNTNTSSMRMYINNAENFDYEMYRIKNGDDILIDYR